MEERLENSLIATLNARRKELDISQERLARMIGVSLPTVQRVFAQSPQHKVSLNTLENMATAMGMTLQVRPSIPASELLLEQAHKRARELAQLVQGNSALEKQGLSEEGIGALESQIFLDLVKGPHSHLWGE